MDETNKKKPKKNPKEEKQPDIFIDNHKEFLDEDSMSQIGIPDIDIKKQMGCGS